MVTSSLVFDYYLWTQKIVKKMFFNSVFVLYMVLAIVINLIMSL